MGIEVRIEALLAAGEHAEGLRLAEEALRSDPERAELHFLAGHLEARMSRPASAIERYTRALELGHCPVASRLHRGQARHARRQYREALEDFQHAEQLTTDHELRTLLAQGQGKAWLALREFQAAHREYSRALHSPGHASFMGLAWACLGMGQVETARDWVQKALGSAPDLAEGFTARALIRLSLGDFEECIEDCGRALWRDPGSYGLLFTRALALQELGRHRAALEDVQHALRLAPVEDHRRFVGLASRAFSHLAEGRRQEAADDFRAAAAHALRHGEASMHLIYSRYADELPEL